MKKIEAIVEPFRLHEVKEALGKLGITGMTITEVRGSASHYGHNEIYRGSEYTIDFLPKMKVEVVLAEEDLDDAVAAILKSAKSGKIAHGKVFVSGIDEATLVQDD